MKIPTRFRKREHGGATIEAAFILPVYFSLVLGFIQFAMILCGYNSATSASRAATRYAIVHGSTSFSQCKAADLQGIVLKTVLMKPISVAVNSVWNPTTAVPGSTVTVTVTLVYKPVIPFVPMPQLTATAISQMTVLQ